MKKKILFVMESLGIGGAEKSLVTILSKLDYSKYDIDLFLFHQKGEFLELLPKEVKLLNIPEDFKSFVENPRTSIKILVKKKKIKLLLYKLIELFNLSLNRFILKKEYIGWNLIKRSVIPINKEYDVAVGFLEKKSIYFTIDKVKAKRKIGWIHTDYKKIKFNYKLDNKYLNELDKVIAVSEPCKTSLMDIFPIIKEKIDVIPNMISNELIIKMANEKITDFNFRNNKVIICTVGRLTEAKGYDMAIQCCEKLVKRGLDFKWIVIGEGSERGKLEKIINEKKLKNTFILLGSRNNPYPYMKNCDIYVQPSRWEGFGITVAEAKVLNKPIICSSIPEFEEQIENNESGLIYKEIDEMEKYLDILISDRKLANKLSKNLSNVNMSNNRELKKLEVLF